MEKLGSKAKPAIVKVQTEQPSGIYKKNDELGDGNPIFCQTEMTHL